MSAVLTGVMALGMLAGIPLTGRNVQAAGSDYGLSNPRLDKENHAVTYDCVYFGSYWQEDTNGDGKADKQDEKTPIKWRVLSVNGDDAFLIADRNLDMQRYHDSYRDVTWDGSTMRSWLNGYGADANLDGRDYTGEGDSFIANAFTPAEQGAVRETAVSNEASPNYGTWGGSDTMDKVFLLSLEEIADEAYGFTNYRNRSNEDDGYWGNGGFAGEESGWNLDGFYYNCGIWDYAKLRANTAFAEGDDTASGDTNTSGIGTGWWWLRSPGISRYNASDVNYYGGCVINGGCYVDSGSSAVCPALHLNLSFTDAWRKAETVTCKPGNAGGDLPEHISDNGVITTPATETADGVKTYTCRVCGMTREAAIPKCSSQSHGLSNPRLDREQFTVTYDCVYFGSYWQEDTDGDGKADKQDEKTPIKWRVLSVNGDDAFLIADRNLDMQSYHDSYRDVTWEGSTMRSWLNGYGADANLCGRDYTGEGDSFIANAFTPAEQGAVRETAVSNEDNLNYGTEGEGGNDTTDKVFLLSLEEIADEAYGFTNYRNRSNEDDGVWGNGASVGEEGYYSIQDYAKLRANTAFAEGGGTASVDTHTSGIGTGWWWLRSPGFSRYNASSVDINGDVYNYGFDVDDTLSAVCPALHLNLSSTDVWRKAETVTCRPGNVGGISEGQGGNNPHTHAWYKGTVTVTPTCKEDGVRTYHCSGCDETKTEAVAKTEEHKWDAGEVTTPATETAEGVKTYTCTVCKTTKTERIPKLTVQNPSTGGDNTGNSEGEGQGGNDPHTHAWDEGTVTATPTCKEDGVRTYHCSGCNETKTEAVAKTEEHKWDAGEVTTPATKTAEGVKTYTCTVCKTTKTECIPKLTVQNPSTGGDNTGNNGANNNGNTGGNAGQTITLPAVSKISGFKASAKKKALSLSWKKVSGAAGYELQYSTKSSFKGAKTKKLAGIKKSCTISKLKAKKKYFVRIRAYKTYKDASGKSQKAYGKWAKLNKKTK